jgi:hypothetical protein
MVKNFLQFVNRVSGTHPTFYPVGSLGSFHGIKRSDREAEVSPESSAEVKTRRNFPSTHPYIFLV